MGYLHIDNLYKNTEILLFRACYALEKIHGTSAHISWKDGTLKYFSGGEKHDRFVDLFDSDFLKNQFIKYHNNDNIIIHGEAYGGKQQGMSATYGKELKFIVFDVMIDNKWLCVPDAEKVTLNLNLEFVDYKVVKTDIDILNFERDSFSTQSKRNGIKEDKLREGIVLRPLIEVTKNNGKRIITKHKGEAFLETKTKREVDPEKLKLLKNADDIANEWVTLMRLNHVLDKLQNPTEIEKTGDVIKAMIEDIRREAVDEIIESKVAFAAIGRKTALIYKKKISKI